MASRANSLLRRTLCSALAIAALTGAGCGGDDLGREDAARLDTSSCDAPLAGATTRLTYRAGGDRDAVVSILCDRLRALRVSHRVRPIGSDRVVVEVPRRLPAGLAVADVQGVANPGRLSFYDWEANVVGPDGRPDPGDAAVTGGSSAGQVGAVSLYAAVLRAAKRPAKVEPDNAREQSVFYGVDPRTKTVHGSATGSPTRARALAAVPEQIRDRAKLHELRPDTVLVRAERLPEARAQTDRWYVLQDDVALRGSEIVDPKQAFDEGPGSSGQPLVTFDFTADGRRQMQALTGELADRGSATKADSPAEANQHFAIVLDDALVSVPFIDFKANPDGIDGSTGSQIMGGFTIRTAQQLASVLKAGELPVALELVGESAAAPP